MTLERWTNFSGKVALITGASRGIGKETALRLAEAGASVAVNFVSSREAAETVCAEIGRDRSIAVQADIGDPEAVRAMIDQVLKRFGRLDILVNNAATFELNPFDNPSYEEWQRGWKRTFEVNIFGAANTSFLAMKPMRRQGGGKIINVASRAAFRGETEFADYGASKAALVNLTKSIARACARDNITATCVAPGFILTDMASEEIAKHEVEILSQIPLGRVGTAEDVAATIFFLASPMSDYLTGATIDVNGGSYVR